MIFPQLAHHFKRRLRKIVGVAQQQEDLRTPNLKEHRLKYCARSTELSMKSVAMGMPSRRNDIFSNWRTATIFSLLRNTDDFPKVSLTVGGLFAEKSSVPPSSLVATQFSGCHPTSLQLHRISPPRARSVHLHLLPPARRAAVSRSTACAPPGSASRRAPSTNRSTPARSGRTLKYRRRPFP